MKTSIADILAQKDAEIAKLRNPWQPIETAPKDGTHILVTSGELMTVAHYHQDGFYLTWNSYAEFADFNMQYVTHWTPLPQPPQTKEAKDAND